MATIQQRKSQDGRIHYRAQVRIKGFPPESATFDSRIEARNWGQQQEVKIRAGMARASIQAKRRTVDEMVKRYIVEVLPRKRSAPGDKAILNWWASKIGGLALIDATPSVLASWRNFLANEIIKIGRQRAPATANRYLAILSHAFTVAVKEWGWLDLSPARNVSKLKEPRGRVRYLSEDERECLLAACRKSENRYLYSVVILALSTGMRQGEIMSLTWDRVDLGRGRVILNDTKNGERRAVPIAGHALQELEELHRKRPEGTNLVFPSKRNLNRASVPIDLRRPWEVALAELKIENFRFHDLRHTAASYMAMNGATLADIGEILGHKTVQMTKRYAHLSESRLQDVVLSMNEKIFGSILLASGRRA